MKKVKKSKKQIVQELEKEFVGFYEMRNELSEMNINIQRREFNKKLKFICKKLDIAYFLLPYRFGFYNAIESKNKQKVLEYILRNKGE
ncbi:hypothetical protein DCO58_11720 [Helicobacter saguini]|uniref:Uncharacterized protein n=1 Tax=Helicobacter saguini TaxID=1548018 RepID=A0A347VQ80_9HELI|nr:hypothetical protein [Helicobacter saguini]MWV61042.1 hypothetical protein [Helicobacter saguini]MWV68289.1 hypothetical protein [Helicobacter saguini]MWV70246.1 hypothetical protein [Helicobacter saguini]MWV72149.1 hypothetical protein [Helicobacter saguini]TLD95211.1 hypothetical protein LS64_002270 [Helicobacter saguini]